MDIEIKKELLRKVVSCATRASSSKAIQPILNNILLASNNGSIVVTATDLDLAIECKLPATVSKPGRVALPAKKLDEIVSKAPGDNVSISIDKNQIAKIVSDRSRFAISSVNHEDFPEIVKAEKENKICSIDQNLLLQGILLTSFAASRFETTSVLSGENFEIRKQEFELGATDGSRLARFVGSLKEAGTDQKLSFVVQSRALTELERLISNFDNEGLLIDIYYLPGQVIFESCDFSLSTRLLSGTFPAYDKLIPSRLPYKAIFTKLELLNSLDRVSVLANERTNVVKLSFKKNSKAAQLTTSSPDYGNANDEIDVEYNGDDIDIAFNYRYLAEALRNLQLDRVTLELESPLSPILLRTSELFDYTYLVMPVQLK